MTTLYDFELKTVDGEMKKLSDYRGKVMLIVNTATKCKFTPQLKGLQELYEKYQEKGFVVLGFPCNQFANQEPHSDEEIKNIYKSEYGVNFPLFCKIEVKGKNAHPLFQHLVKNAPGLFGKDIKWNFTKFLIDQDGNVVKRYSPIKEPEKINEGVYKLFLVDLKRIYKSVKSFLN